VAALEALDGRLGAGPEDAVGTDAELTLEQDDGRSLAAAGRRLACTAGLERAPRGGPDDAVSGQPVAALEALDGALGAGAEDAVGGDAEPALDLRHARALRAALERLRVGGAGREQQSSHRECRDAAASCVRHVSSVPIGLSVSPTR
jgi:hypothetical protein